MATKMGDACLPGRLFRYVTVLLLVRQHPLLSSFSNPPPGSISPPSGSRLSDTEGTGDRYAFYASAVLAVAYLYCMMQTLAEKEK